MAISGGKLDLLECGPAAEEVQSLTTTSRFILSPRLRRRRGEHLQNRFSREREADHDRTAHINGMPVISHAFGVSQE
jgi:hypothetical protein